MSAEMDNFTKKLLERTQNRAEALRSKTQDLSARKKRPLEEKNENISDAVKVTENKEIPQKDAGSQIESPNKRSRLILNTEPAQEHEVIGNNTASSESNLKPAKQAKGSTIGDRMKRLLDKRMQWEAADKGDEVDFDSVLTPDFHESPPVVLPTPNTPQRKINAERKAKFAALAQEINEREDDLSHPVKKQSPEKVKQWKPPTGRKTPMSQIYESDIYNKEESPVEKQAVTKNVSKRVSLSIETLAQFAGKKSNLVKQNEQILRTPVRITTEVQGKLNKDKITISSCKQPSSHQVTPTNKSLQQRVLELQQNGVDSKLTERQKELNNLKDEEEDNSFNSDQESENEEMAVTDPISIISNNSPQKDFPHITVQPSEDNNLNQQDENSSMENSLVEDNPEEQTAHGIKGSDQNNVSGSQDEEEDSDEDLEGSTISYGDSMMDDEEVGEEKDEADDNNDEDEIGEISAQQEQDESDLIDELFDGMEEVEEELGSPSRAESPLLDVVMASGSLTRQKSRQEIRTELTTRNQTCNEAEDTRQINASRCRRPLARSNSTESLASMKDQPVQSYPVFTLDSYRTQRKSTRQLEKVVRKESMSSLKSPTHQPSTVKEQVAEMMLQVQQQQRVIQQASAALNCCYDAQHGKGSITELEAEKLLLIASEKRLALLSEIQAIKNKPPTINSKACKGSISLSDIKLPLRTEYIFSMASKKDGGEIRGHYYFILVRCGARNIMATHLASTHESLSADSLVFKNKFELKNLDSNFKIDIEVYSVNHRSRADGVPNQEKSKGKLSGILHKTTTSKKLEKVFQKTKAKVNQVRGTAQSYTLNKLETPTVVSDSLTPRKNKARGAHRRVSNHQASPGGPNAIRISNFSLIGSVAIKLGEVKQNKFGLEKVPFMSPISGQLVCNFETNFQSNVEQRGFLTMFNDVGGLGAWHRRWCYLNQGVLYSWTYPDDEKNKEPLSQLKVSECISREISMVGRIMCARPNTFEIRTMRPRRQGDCDNLISQDTGSVITTKYWLAADTKEERVVWIESLNQALNDVRAWDPNALKPLR